MKNFAGGVTQIVQGLQRLKILQCSVRFMTGLG